MPGLKSIKTPGKKEIRTIIFTNMKKIQGIAKIGKHSYYWIAEYSPWKLRVLGKCRAYIGNAMSDAAALLAKKHGMVVKKNSYFTSPPVEAVFEDMLNEHLKKMLSEKIEA